MNIESITQCTRCKKELKEFKIDINFNIRVDREKESSVWEYIPNLDNNSREVLCVDCFNKFSELMGNLNIKNNE